MRLPNKDPSEIKLLRFQFKDDIQPGTTIALVELSVAAVSGVDPAVADVLQGAAQINNAALEVLQAVRLGVDGVDYELRCLATDSGGLKHLVSAALPVRRFAVRALN